MNYFLLYLILRLNCISGIAFALSIVTGIIFGITLVALAVNQKNEEDFRLTKLWTKPAAIVFCAFVFLGIVVPTTKQAAVVYCLPKIVNNEQVQKIPNNLLRLANSWIDEAVNQIENPVNDTNSTTN